MLGIVTDSAPSNSLVAYDVWLNVRWRDAIHLKEKYLLRLHCGDRYAFVVHVKRTPPRGRMELFVVESDTGRLRAHRVVANLRPNLVPSQLKTVGNHLVLGGRDWTLIFPGATDVDPTPDSAPPVGTLTPPS